MRLEPQSPFMQPAKNPTFGVAWLLLLTVVAAATMAMVSYSFFLPAVTNEVNAWLGRSLAVVDQGDDRRAHVIFLVLCYSIPMALVFAAHMVQRFLRIVIKMVAQSQATDEEFRMS